MIRGVGDCGARLESRTEEDLVPAVAGKDEIARASE